jgi:hypothetical protein
VHPARKNKKVKAMKIKTNLRAGSGGASGAGGNSAGSHSSANDPVVVQYNYVLGSSRCAGL